MKLINGQVMFVAFASLGFRLIHTTGFFVHQWNIRLRNLSEVLYVSDAFL